MKTLGNTRKNFQRISYINSSRRSQRGSMLILAILVIFLLIMFLTQLSSFIAVLVAHQQLQNEAESFEVRAVGILNESDRNGRINGMTASSRELVFDSRLTDNDMAQSTPQLEPLAKMYLEQSREGARVVANEREKIMASTISELQGLSSEIKQRSQVKGLLPWAYTKNLSVAELEVGYSKDEESNVQPPLGNPDLLLVDQEHKYFDRDTNLYYGNISLKLPQPDDDLTFKLSALPAPVVNTVPQAHIDEGRTFVKTLTVIHNHELAVNPTTCEFFPSAARITFVREFQNSLGVKTETQIATRESGTTNGASPPPL